MTLFKPMIDEWLATYDTPATCAAHVLCDRHDPARVALSVVDPTTLEVETTTYGDLARTSSRLATLLAERGVRPGDRVPVLMEKSAELVTALLALWRIGAVHVPLFTAFASGAIQLRIEGSRATHVITEPSQRDKLVSFDQVEVIEIPADLAGFIAASDPWRDAAVVGGDGLMLQLYTSGTTGKPKGVGVPLRALAAFHSYMELGLDVRDDDVFWNAADPGWAYGLYYGILGPLATGRANIFVRGSFDPKVTVDVLRTMGVTNFAGAPTIYRALSQVPAASDLTLRRASSAGEPLTPDVIAWSRDALGVEVRDHYGQTELGMVIANCWHDDLVSDVRAGSMGRGMPGIVAGIVDGQIAISTEHSQLLWFREYVDEPQKSLERFTDDHAWYLTSDAGRVDDDGYVYFTARDDDVILAAGYRIGPFEVESVLAMHDAVAEVAVVGRPDPERIRGEMVEAFVVLKTGTVSSEALADDLKRHVRETYSKHAYPRQVHFVESLPKTASGKIQRFVLRAQDPPSRD